MELIFHKSEEYIDEDIFYYISDQRDKHSMIKPKKENLISMTVDSEKLLPPCKNEITNVFYPFKKNSIDKIYIGLSFSESTVILIRFSFFEQLGSIIS